MKYQRGLTKHTFDILRRPAAIAVLAIVAGRPFALSAQAPRTIKTVTGLREFPTPFSSVRGVHELQDGRVVVIDELEIAVSILDFRTQTKTPLGREGAGPGEYGWPTQLIDLGGDSVAVMDELHRRMLVIRGDGTFGEVLTSQGRKSGDPLDGIAPATTSGDDVGRLYGLIVSRDSASVVRWRSFGKQVDSLARFPVQLRAIGNTGLSSTVLPYSPAVAWAVGSAGEVAVVYPSPYRVDITAPGGSVKRGPWLAHRPLPLSDAHKREWLAKARKPRIGMMVTGGPSGPVSSAQRVSRPVREPSNWPATLPPFLPGAARFSPSGLLWIRRTASDPATASYDVIDENAVIVASVSFALGTEVVGFGRTHVFTTRTTDDGLIFLQRVDDPLSKR